MIARRAFGMLAIAAAIALAAEVRADVPLPDGAKTITLIGASGERVAIGTATFTRAEDGASFEIALDPKRFQDEFLSMRPFSCLASDKEMWCHLAYPYDLKRKITARDLTDLEYALLFLFKPPAGYGIDPWNGLYFKMSLQDDGVVAGELHDVNLDPLGTPPADRSARTITPDQLTKSDAASRRFSRVEIK